MLVVLLLMILWPLAEIYLAVIVAQALGTLEMLALVALGSFGGLLVLRNESRMAWTRFNEAMRQRQQPSREVGDGLLGFAGGALLLIPGLLSDAVGLLLILPPTKPLARRLVGVMVMRRVGLSRSRARWTRSTYSTYSTGETGADFDVTATAEEIHDEPDEGAEAQPADQRRLPPE